MMKVAPGDLRSARIVPPWKSTQRAGNRQAQGRRRTAATRVAAEGVEDAREDFGGNADATVLHADFAPFGLRRVALTLTVPSAAY